MTSHYRSTRDRPKLQNYSSTALGTKPNTNRIDLRWRSGDAMCWQLGLLGVVQSTGAQQVPRRSPTQRRSPFSTAAPRGHSATSTRLRPPARRPVRPHHRAQATRPCLGANRARRLLRRRRVRGGWLAGFGALARHSARARASGASAAVASRSPPSREAHGDACRARPPAPRAHARAQEHERRVPGGRRRRLRRRALGHRGARA
mmetsp:Transcript_40938/g.108215  ORF Transcript_40938/g.108215 Transcript_40938/m.108215 type:complete len:204 (+) Transcript_40938:41-652(+)